jgi:hypothetical protein
VIEQASNNYGHGDEPHGRQAEAAFSDAVVDAAIQASAGMPVASASAPHLAGPEELHLLGEAVESFRRQRFDL